MQENGRYDILETDKIPWIFSSLMRTLHLSAEQAMAALEVPEAKRSGLAAKP